MTRNHHELFAAEAVAIAASAVLALPVVALVVRDALTGRKGGDHDDQ